MLLRRTAMVIGLSTSVVVAAVLALAPELVISLPLWAVWALAMTGVVAVYVSGHVMRARFSGRQSRRTRRFMESRQS
jgi:hypothetical protein